MDASDFLFETLEVHRGSQYGMETVSQLEHALQCAALAEQEDASAPLIVSALFHDLGHLIGSGEEDVSRQAVDDRHETKGAAMLSRWFGADVTEPVRLHVAAKRYLCAVEPRYRDGLSPASLLSLELQGNPFDGVAARDFARKPYAKDAIRLRRWDDRAKVPGLDIPKLNHYRERVDLVITNASRRVAAW